MTVRKLGGATIEKVEEICGPGFKPHRMFPKFNQEAFDAQKGWMLPEHVEAGSDRLVGSVHTWIVKTPRHTILIDTCLGNDKQRTNPGWRNLDTPFLGRLKACAPRPAAGAFAQSCAAVLKESCLMLRAYPLMLSVMRRLRPVLVQIEKHDRDLGNQLRRASASVALNLAEGSGSAGGTRNARYRTALGSARETGACIDVAEALGYVERVETLLLDELDQVRAILVRVTM